MDRSQLIPLLVILGPTASGKSRLGFEAAKVLGGEIISADAFSVYRGLDIGTDKPSLEDRKEVPHHLVDVADPKVPFSAGAFADAAEKAIDEITNRNNVPLVVGGTHFYVRALLLGLFPSPARDSEIGRRLAEDWSQNPSVVYRRLLEVDPIAAERIGPNDRQRVLRALEVFELTGETMTDHWNRQQPTPKYNPVIAMPDRPRDELYAKIEVRVDRMFNEGMVEEVKRILASGVSPDAHSLKAIGYREVVEMLQNRYDLETAIDRTKRSSRKLAKRQLTWLRTLKEGTLHRVPPVEKDGLAAVIRLWRDHTGRKRTT